MNTNKAIEAYKKQKEINFFASLSKNQQNIDNKQKAILKFNQTLNSYDYGIILDGVPLTGYDIDFNKYKTISPEDFKKYKTGVCWDYVEYEAQYFIEHFKMRLTTYPLKLNNTFSMYYMQHIDQDGDMPSHTWLGYKHGGNIFSFESSWKSLQGIQEYITEKDMVYYYLIEQEKYYASKNNKLSRYVVIKYTPMPRYNLTPEEYMNIILDNGIVIESTIKSYPIRVSL